MTRILKMLLFLFLIYYVIQLIFLFVSPGYELNYEFTNNNQTMKIKENYDRSNKGFNNYYFAISVNDNNFYYQLITPNTIGKKMIVDIKYYQDDEYQCILPIFKNNKIEYDITCFHNGQTDYYYNLKNQNNNLDKFAQRMSSYGYNADQFVNNESDFAEANNMILYNKNIIKDYNLAVTTRKSAYTSSDNYHKFVRADFFSPSAIIPQTTPIRTFVNNFIIIPDYSQKDTFNQFILVNRNGNNKSLLDTVNISFNSYIQGAVGNSFYLIDRDSKKQYEVNIKDRTSVVVGTEKSGIKFYNNNTWENKPMSEALNNNLYFMEYVTDVTKEFSGYDKVIKYGNKNSGYYYFFKKNGDKYDVYYANVQNKDNITYLFTSLMDNIKYFQDYIYFTDGNYIKYYNHRTGLRTFVKSTGDPIVDYNLYYE